MLETIRYSLIHSHSPKPVSVWCVCIHAEITRFQVGKGDLSSEQLPQTQGIAEHVCLDSVAGTLSECLWGHPAQVQLPAQTLWLPKTNCSSAKASPREHNTHTQHLS